MDETGPVVSVRNPYEDANLVSRLTYWWLHKLITKGFKRNLHPQDLYRPLKSDESNIVYLKLQKEWDYQQEKENNNQKSSLMRAIWSVVGRKIIYLGFLYFIKFFVLASINVFCMSQIIRAIESGNKYNRNIIYYVVGLITSFTISFLLIHKVGLKVERLSMRMRVACCSMIFRKAMRLSKSLMASASAGKLFNIIAGDVAKFDQLTLFPLGVWIDPIGSVAVLAYLYPMYGVAVLPGIGVLYLNAVFQLFQARMFSSLRMKKSLATDERLNLIHGVVSDIKTVKMYSWETPFSDVIKRVRRQELRVIASTMILRIFNMVVYVSGSKFPLFLAILTALYLGQTIRAEMVFATYALYNILKLNLTFTFPNAVQKVAECMVSVRRIQDILTLDEKAKAEQTSCLDSNQNELCSVIAQDLTVSWSQEATSFKLSNIYLSLANNELCFITGPVGSGKSSLLLALMGEMLPTEGSVTLNGRIAYVSQEPWLFPASIRKNIVFSLPFDEKRYRQVLDACALHEDINHFPDGDGSYVGDKGVTLSGGQKARIHLARSIYHNADIYLLDDCLCAVDARVGNHIFKNCINGLIGKNLRVLVTHQLQYITPESYAVFMNTGRICKQGKYDDMRVKEKSQDVDNSSHIFSLDSMDVQELQEKPVKEDKDSKKNQMSKNGFDEVIIKQSSFHAYLTYFKSVNSWTAIALFLLINCASQIIGMSYEIWLTIWTQAESRVAADSPSFSSNGLFLNETGIPIVQTSYIRVLNFTLSSSHEAFLVFACITIAVLLITILRTTMFFGFTFMASTTIHNRLMKAVMRSKMSFFNSNPAGRIVNRFSKDMEAIDDVLPAALFEEITEMSTLLEVLAIVIYVDIWLGIPILFLVALFVLICICYFRTAIFIKRIEAIRRSPIFTLLSNSIQGQVTIRAHKAENVLAKEFDEHQDSHTTPWFLFIATTRCLSVSMEALLSIFITVILITVIITSEKFTGSEIGLLITLATKLTTSMQWGVKQAAEVENQITSVERIDEYSKLPPEDGYDTKLTDTVPRNWPIFGAIKFHDVSLFYSFQEAPILKRLCFEIKAGERVGVVGRTGAGKSSLITALFRLAEIQGNVEIDGINTASVPLQFLRRAFSIIPQEPVLFVGSVRYNLDPFCQYSDEALWLALGEVQVKEAVQSMDNGLNAAVSEGGSNFSVGQRQLLCLCRAILRKCKIILLDEATSNCDKSCDAIIQRVLRKRFADCTILIIAHRLDTIIDCDKVMIMDDGHLIEFDEPYVLLQNEHSAFKNLVDQTGNSASSQLVNRAHMHHLYKTRESSKIIV